MKNRQQGSWLILSLFENAADDRVPVLLLFRHNASLRFLRDARGRLTQALGQTLMHVIAYWVDDAILSEGKS
jgi:hypothetical protein